jgi:Protein of unknown function (DUF3618)
MRNDTNSGSKSADEVQREVRQSRAEVEDALEAIQDRLSPGQMFDQAVNYLRGSGGNEFMRNLGATVRDNPVPLALLGTGLAWLMFSRARPRRPYDQDEDSPGEYSGDYYGAGDYPAGYPEGHDDGFGDRPFGSEAAARAEPGLASDQGFVERAKETAAAAGATAQGLAEGAAELGRDWATGARESAQEWSAGARATAVHARARVRRLGAGARERLGDTGDSLRDSARGAQARAGYYGRRIQRGFFDTLHEQPLVLGAVGLAVGAAIGAALPATETEDEWMGDTRDRLKDHASEAGREQLAKVGAAAGAAYDAAREEADRQGLTPEAAVAGAGSMAEKVERVAEAASGAANTEAQPQKLGQTDDKPV